MTLHQFVVTYGRRKVLLILGASILSLWASCKHADFAGRSNKGGRSGGNNNDGGKNPNDPNDPDNNDPNNPGNGTPTPNGGLGTGDGSGRVSVYPKPKFALMSRDLRCGMCHLQVNGDLATAGDVMPFDPDRSLPAPGSDDHIRSPFRWITLVGEYNEKVNGTWFVKGSFPSGRSRTEMKLAVSGGIKENYTGVEIPKSGFPVLDLAKAAAVSKGTLEGKDQAGADVRVLGSAPTNIVIDGSNTPFKIAGEILVNGDLVILGRYSGIGTIYATGNIYVAGSISASSSPFPFAVDLSQRAAAIAQGKAKVQQEGLDALALVSNSAIIVGDPNHQTVSVSSKMSPPPVAEKNIFSWYPGNENGYRNLYKGKVGKGIPIKWDAFFYSKTMIAGKTGPYVLNGGMISDSFHILGLANSGISPNTINYDYRMMSGLKVMEAFDTSF
jgi:hypothetical protein